MKKTSHIDTFLPLVVFTVFAVCLLAVLLSGAGIYKDLNDHSEALYTRRVTTQYLITRVRQAQSVHIDDFHGCESLTIREEIDGDTYLTRVYCHDGSIRELFSTEDAPVLPEDGTPIAADTHLSFALDDGLLTINTDHGVLSLWVPMGREVRP